MTKGRSRFLTSGGEAVTMVAAVLDSCEYDRELVFHR